MYWHKFFLFRKTTHDDTFLEVLCNSSFFVFHILWYTSESGKRNKIFSPYLLTRVCTIVERSLHVPLTVSQGRFLPLTPRTLCLHYLSSNRKEKCVSKHGRFKTRYKHIIDNFYFSWLFTLWINVVINISDDRKLERFCVRDNRRISASFVITGTDTLTRQW